MQLEINGNTLDVHVEGPDGAPAVIALHGGPGVEDRRDLTEAFHGLSDRYRIITFDARGSGLSGQTPPFTHDQWVADIDELRKRVDAEHVIVAGHSYGGMVALEYAITHPDNVAALVLIDTAASDTFRANSRWRAQESGQVKLDPDLFVRLWEGRVASDDELRLGVRGLLPLHGVPDDQELMDSLMSVKHFHHRTHNHAFGTNLPCYDVTARLGAITCPTLVMVGRHDWATPPEESRKIADAVMGARLVIFENSGHVPLHEEREAWLDAVSLFLAEAAPAY